MKKNKKAFSWFGIVGGLLLLTIISWMMIETGIEISSHADFCGECHAMEPMVKSYHDSTHGGNNPRGVMAACTDCHVSHKNVFTHFVGKARSGTHDAWVTMTEISPPRLARITKPSRRVCLRFWMPYLPPQSRNATADNRFHDNYFDEVTDTQCVTCHEEVGHDNLNKYLLETKYKYHFDE